MPRRSCFTECTVPRARTPPNRGAAGLSPIRHSTTSTMSPRWPTGCARKECIPARPRWRWIAAQADAQTRGIDPAVATGHCRLLTRTQVRRIVTDHTGRRVHHVEAVGPDGAVSVTGGKFVLAAGAVNSAALLLASADHSNPSGLANSSDQVGRNFMMHNNAHIAAVDLNRDNDVRFQKTLAVNDWYLDGGGGYPLGSLQLLGKVRGIMMKSWATRIPLWVLNRLAQRSVEWLVMAEDLPDPANRVTIDSAGAITTARVARGARTHRLLHKRAKRLFHACGYDATP